MKWFGIKQYASSTISSCVFVLEVKSSVLPILQARQKVCKSDKSLVAQKNFIVLVIKKYLPFFHTTIIDVVIPSSSVFLTTIFLWHISTFKARP